MAENVTRILGIDPGLNITGYGVIEINSGQVTVLEAGVVRGKRNL
jgi:crossover junction endodeoxyribonuclease RuvC